MGRTLVTEVVQTFNCSPDELWPVFGPGWASLKLWMPGVKSCSLSPPNVEVGAVRSVIVKGNQLSERMIRYDPDDYFTEYLVLDPHPYPVKGLYGNTRLERNGENGTKITWWADADEADEEGIKVAGPYLTSLFESGLGSLHKLLEA
ncbi:uncharacterized protein BDZ99DRAFT_497606 [Mytilinidion resinicola]|uniref:SRPBCC family protein n=1 Tax=Mytilinidion resinicola TaxID=574789 RepID=A0A6A6YSW4_9PEZI|nr:uncharacterized protein BDZ99DRAFT_497606 [Mytilinidion resinicola]KAF2812012.1 hypothetical protein BDZ99DRAFT_497606 [Mytilinidion resinicola]